MSYFPVVRPRNTRGTGNYSNVAGQNDEQIEKRKERLQAGGVIALWKRRIDLCLVELHKELEKVTNALNDEEKAQHLLERKYLFLVGPPGTFGSAEIDTSSFWTRNFGYNGEVPLGARKILQKADKANEAEMSGEANSAYFERFRRAFEPIFKVNNSSPMVRIAMMLSIQAHNHEVLATRGRERSSLLSAVAADGKVCETFKCIRSKKGDILHLIAQLRKNHPNLAFEDSEVGAMISDQPTYQKLCAFMNVHDASLKDAGLPVRKAALIRLDIMTAMAAAQKLGVSFSCYGLDLSDVKDAFDTAVTIRQDLNLPTRRRGGGGRGPAPEDGAGPFIAGAEGSGLAKKIESEVEKLRRETEALRQQLAERRRLASRPKEDPELIARWQEERERAQKDKEDLERELREFEEPPPEEDDTERAEFRRAREPVKEETKKSRESSRSRGRGGAPEKSSSSVVVLDKIPVIEGDGRAREVPVEFGSSVKPDDKALFTTMWAQRGKPAPPFVGSGAAYVDAMTGEILAREKAGAFRLVRKMNGAVTVTRLPT